MAQKLENRWSCLNSFDQGCSFPSGAQSAVLQLCLLNGPIPSCAKIFPVISERTHIHLIC